MWCAFDENEPEKEKSGVIGVGCDPGRKDGQVVTGDGCDGRWNEKASIGVEALDGCR